MHTIVADEGISHIVEFSVKNIGLTRVPQTIYCLQWVRRKHQFRGPMKVEISAISKVWQAIGDSPTLGAVNMTQNAVTKLRRGCLNLVEAGPKGPKWGDRPQSVVASKIVADI